VDFFIDFQIFSVNSRKSAQNMEKFTRVSKPQNWKEKTVTCERIFFGIIEENIIELLICWRKF
jgi:hypothetical protein